MKYLPCAVLIYKCLFCRATLLLIPLLFRDPSLEPLLFESSSLRIEIAESRVMVWSAMPPPAMFWRRIWVWTISRLMSSAISGEWDLTLVWSPPVLPKQIAKKVNIAKKITRKAQTGQSEKRSKLTQAQNSLPETGFLTVLPGMPRLDARRSRTSLLACKLGYIAGLLVLSKMLH